MPLKNTDKVQQSRKCGREVDEESIEPRERRLAKRREREKEHCADEHGNAMRLRQ